ncbi:undecaprenyl-diphosphate phosphatase [Aeoliella sp. ICT_H6.2]|uniref:Undecaprenyl-diphosphatase n=1 Tax=Aeoliella straminimaris TaxID=2954799 RepID=A0A9X2JGJ4_9BACT|nr:undecaprenyl-diphosphate phosphatase [Aeoliella straminimaris]MCO6043633.1 undecaprenyl-diphosphate phosphatase [Aeoliella straminimaris]
MLSYHSVLSFAHLQNASIMGLVEVVILAIVQGLTEFLPVSSSGHLVVANALLKQIGYPPTEDLVEVNIVLHLGTLLAVLVYYRREIIRMLTRDRQVAAYVVVGTVPAAIAGVFLKKGLEDHVTAGVLENVLVAGCMFPVTAALLVFAMRRKPGEGEYTQLGFGKSIMIGIAQACALLPGISRSGSTIAAGIACGLKREEAATFAFLLAIPAIAGAGVLEGLDVLDEGSSTALGVLAVGFVLSFLVGWASLVLLIRFVRQGTLSVFAWYLVPLGIAVVTWQLWQMFGTTAAAAGG